MATAEGSLKRWRFGTVGLTIACAISLSAAGQSASADSHTPALSAAAAGTSLVSRLEPSALLQSTGNLYWTVNTADEFGPNSSSVYRSAKTGLPGTERLLYREKGQHQFSALAYAKVGGIWFGYVVARDNLTTSRIVRFHLDGGGLPQTIVTSASPRLIGDLKTDGTSLFWADRNGIRAKALAGGATRTVVQGQRGQNFDTAKLGLAGTRLFYALDQRIRYVPKAGGLTTGFINTQTPITTLHVTGSSLGTTRVYWGERSGIVASKGLSGVTNTWQRPQTGRYTASVSFDGARVLWTDCANNGLQCAVRFRGKTVVTIAKNLTFARGVQGDSLRTFWADYDGLKRYTH